MLTQPDILQQIADLAPSLPHTAMRVILELARQANPLTWKAATSQPELATRTGCTERSIRTATKTLAERHLIEAKPGRQHQRTIYTLRFAREESVSALEPREETVSALREENVSALEPREETVSALREESVSALKPREETVSALREESVSALKPREETVSALREESVSAPHSKEHARAGAFDSNERTNELNTRSSLSTRSKEEAAAAIVTADPAAYTEEEHAWTAEAITEYHRNLHKRDANGYAITPAHLPDPTITAQILAAATSQEELKTILQYMIHKKLKAGSTWAWFVPTVAEIGPLQIPRKLISEARQQLTERKASQPAQPAAEQTTQRRAAR